eukprot:TRINITY_DN1909_c0_g1_i2.p1 TRINITY_DN1909_c0_g1~~TRINITY_DN1909_c0_g1_i2.p1  ORF type:complete len:581 (-),score=121.04 TRINITY_DN1909_c0_g1_i2:175-1815(-)
MASAQALPHHTRICFAMAPLGGANAAGVTSDGGPDTPGSLGVALPVSPRVALSTPPSAGPVAVAPVDLDRSGGEAAGSCADAGGSAAKDAGAGAGAAGAPWYRRLCGQGPLTLLAVILGIVLGRVLAATLGTGGADPPELVLWLKFPGDLWLRALKCIVLPLIVFNMISSMVQLRKMPGSRTVGIAVVLIYTSTTLLAAIEGCISASLVLGSADLQLQSLPASKSSNDIAGLSTRDTVIGIFNQLVPGNIIDEAAKGRILAVIIVSIVIGLLVKDKREDGSKSATIELVDEMSAVVMSVVFFLMKLTPIGVGSLVLGSVASMDMAQVAGGVSTFIASVVLGMAFHTLLVYPTMILVLGARNPLRYVLNIVPPLTAALGTSSSAAALPLSLSHAIEKNKIPAHMAQFVLTLGATMNMDGTTIYLICATYFLGALQGVQIGIGKFCIMSLMATLCSMGSAPIPSASLILLATVMGSVGVQLTSSFGVIVAIDWMLDRFKTVTNVYGDHAVTSVIAHWFPAAYEEASTGKTAMVHQESNESSKSDVACV